MAGAALAIVSTAVYAQTDNQASDNRASNANVRAQLTQMLAKSGFTDLKVAPSAFMVHAKDSDGNPVVMSISPDSFASVTVDAGTTTGKASNSPNDTYVSVPGSNELSSQLVGLDIYNKDNKDIGAIKDIAFDSSGRTTAYIVSVGGFLGIGDHYVAIRPSSVDVTYDQGQKKWKASMNATADELKAAPEFKYNGRWADNT
jgi:sporulation protein YlmC with PRC-barrel domain